MSTTVIPLSKFGKDHWSTFAYIETRVVDFKGEPNREHMRCDPARHPGLGHRGSTSPCYPTRLRLVGGKFEMVPDHDDWDCAGDLEREGLCHWKGTGINPVFTLTPYGEQVAAALRAFKAKGGNYCDFVAPIMSDGWTKHSLAFQHEQQQG